MKTYNKEFPTSKPFIYTKKFKALIWLFCPKISPLFQKRPLSECRCSQRASSQGNLPEFKFELQYLSNVEFL